MEEEKKLKVLMIGDNPMAPSGVGTQIKYICEGLLDAGIAVRNVAGSRRHEGKDYRIIKFEDKDWQIFPVDDYGSPEIIRDILRKERPDMLWIMTDPRYYEWLWSFDNEIRALVPIVYYHVWDNYPVPKYNEKWYGSNDYIVSISKLTQDIVEQVAPCESEYLPHAVDPEIFCDLTGTEELAEYKKSIMADVDDDTFVFIWNNRNAKRKKAGTLLSSFKRVVEEVGEDKVVLIMHTAPHEIYGPPLPTLVEDLGIPKKCVRYSHNKLHPKELNMLYNVADAGINISDAEGWGLSVTEALSAGRPVIVSMTGGHKDQVTDGKEFFGIGLEPDAKVLLGTPQVPYIYEDHVSEENIAEAMIDMIRMDPKERRELGRKGAEHVRKNFNFNNYKKRWVEIVNEVHEKFGSWDTRKGYERYTVEKI